MKRTRRSPKTTASLSASVQRHVNLYALAAGAAGVGLVAVAQPAEAKIVYTPAYDRLSSGTLPIPVDGTSDFTLSNNYYVVTGSFSTQLLKVNATGSASVAGARGSAAALAGGVVIGSKVPFQAGKLLMAGAFRETQISASSVFGHFANTTKRFLGLKFKIQGRVHYGWARFSHVRASAKIGPRVVAVLTGWAYETVPGKSIVAGETNGPDEISAREINTTGLDKPVVQRQNSPAYPLPAREAATLGVLALGSSGLHVWRREETASGKA